MTTRHTFRISLWLAALGSLFLLMGCAYRSDKTTVLVNAEAVRLAALNSNNDGTPVKLDAVVT